MSDVSLASNNSLGVDLVDGPGGFYNSADHSGPYAVGSDGTATLIGGDSNLRQLGYQQITGLSSPTSLAVPAGATRATVVVEVAAVRWRADGVAPTASVGNLLPVGSTKVFEGTYLAAQFIQAAAGAILNVNFVG